jgi:hypothetical protein
MRARQLEIREVEHIDPAECASIAHLFSRCFPEQSSLAGLTAEQIARWHATVLQAINGSVFVAHRSGEVLAHSLSATLSFRYRSKLLRFRLLGEHASDPAIRRTGVMKRLYEAQRRRAEALGADCIGGFARAGTPGFSFALNCGDRVLARSSENCLGVMPVARTPLGAADLATLADSLVAESRERVPRPGTARGFAGIMTHSPKAIRCPLYVLRSTVIPLSIAESRDGSFLVVADAPSRLFTSVPAPEREEHVHVTVSGDLTPGGECSRKLVALLGQGLSRDGLEATRDPGAWSIDRLVLI